MNELTEYEKLWNNEIFLPSFQNLDQILEEYDKDNSNEEVLLYSKSLLERVDLELIKR